MWRSFEPRQAGDIVASKAITFEEKGFPMNSKALLHKGAMAALLVLPLSLGACATTKSVDEAKTMAQQAQATADQALAEAKAASAKADAANEKADRMFHKGLKK
jgi:Alanine-zipper, major outer membrane lipoprotein